VWSIIANAKQQPSQTLHHKAQLDGARGIAIILVPADIKGAEHV